MTTRREERITVSISDYQKNILREVADQYETGLSTVVRWAVRDFVEQKVAERGGAS